MQQNQRLTSELDEVSEKLQTCCRYATSATKLTKRRKQKPIDQPNAGHEVGGELDEAS